MTPRPERGSFRALTLTLLALALALALLAAQRWRLPEPAARAGSAAAAPCWVMLGPLQATTEDGSILRVRLALDACDAGSRSAIDDRRSDLESIVLVVVAQHSRHELEGGAGIERLRATLKLRLSEHVQAVGAEGVRDVVVDQFVLRRI